MSVSLICPKCRSGLESAERRFDCRACGATYPVVAGIPRLLESGDPAQLQTAEMFSYFWRKHGHSEFGDPGHRDVYERFFVERFGLESDASRDAVFAGASVLDVGVGAGSNEFVFIDRAAEVWGVDIAAGIEVARDNLSDKPQFRAVQADVSSLPFADGSFDVVWSDSSLHHCPDTRLAVHECARTLREGGRLLFYVFKKKAPIREFTDDFVRAQISDLPLDEAWEAMKPVTRLARGFCALDVTVELEEDVPLLGFARGKYDLQRFLYWHVLKFYWNDALDFDQNNYTNFGYFYPKYAHRHSPDEVLGWMRELGLDVERFHEGDAGLSVVARKPALRSGAKR